jgi:hypothetical protein
MKTDKYFLIGSFITMIGAVAFPFWNWGVTFAIYSLLFLTLGLLYNLKDI